jgi:hypothetical protein
MTEDGFTLYVRARFMNHRASQDAVGVKTQFKQFTHGADNEPGAPIGENDSLGGGTNCVGLPIHNGEQYVVKSELEIIGLTCEDIFDGCAGTHVRLVGDPEGALTFWTGPHGWCFGLLVSLAILWAGARVQRKGLTKQGRNVTVSTCA